MYVYIYIYIYIYTYHNTYIYIEREILGSTYYVYIYIHIYTHTYIYEVLRAVTAPQRRGNAEHLGVMSIYLSLYIYI